MSFLEDLPVWLGPQALNHTQCLFSNGYEFMTVPFRNGAKAEAYFECSLVKRDVECDCHLYQK